MLRIGIDIGGTFTDFTAWSDARAEGGIVTLKVPSSPPDFADAVKTGIDEILKVMPAEADEPVLVMHGTTVSTNMVIERAGPPIAFFTTKGFRDLLNLQRLRMKNPTNLFDVRPLPLVPRELVFEIDERVLPDGSVRKPLPREEVALAAKSAAAMGARGIAVAFLHSFRYPGHERAARDAIAEALPGMSVSLSSEIWPQVGEYERAIVALLNAYARERMDAYLGEIEAHLTKRLPAARLFITRSNGGAMAAAEARSFPVHTLLSGPASGVTAAQSFGAAVGERHLLTLDMGGTSTDISLIRDGEPTMSNDAEVGDFPLVMPVTGIEAIGAGGGSVAWIDAGVLRVGPRSAGARPGPACYGKGGTEPTITDAYLISGYLDPTSFLGGRMRLDPKRADAAMRPIAEALDMDVDAAADACIAVATSNMIATVLPYLARLGVDPEELSLLLYGGAGALHGPLLAAEIGINRVIIPKNPSVFCAYGGLVAELVHDVVESAHGIVLSAEHLKVAFADLDRRARDWLRQQIDPGEVRGIQLEHWGGMRYRGQSYQLQVRFPAEVAKAGGLTLALDRFHAEHERLYSHADPKATVEILELGIRVRGRLPSPKAEPLAGAAMPLDGAVIGRRSIRLGGRLHRDVAVYGRDRLRAGHDLEGPCIVEQADATILVPGEFGCKVGPLGELALVRRR